MSDNPFAFMAAALFGGPLAEDIRHNGKPGRAFVHRGIQVIGEYNQILGTRTDVEIPSGTGQKDDTIVIGVQTYVLDVRLSDDGTFDRWVVRLDA